MRAEIRSILVAGVPTKYCQDEGHCIALGAIIHSVRAVRFFDVGLDLERYRNRSEHCLFEDISGSNAFKENKRQPRDTHTEDKAKSLSVDVTMYYSTQVTMQ